MYLIEFYMKFIDGFKQIIDMFSLDKFTNSILTKSAKNSPLHLSKSKKKKKKKKLCILLSFTWNLLMASNKILIIAMFSLDNLTNSILIKSAKNTSSFSSSLINQLSWICFCTSWTWSVWKGVTIRFVSYNI